jgi:hypothetical protein
MLTLAAVLLLSAAPPRPAPGEVTLPLRDYLALIERIEANDAAQTAARTRAEPAVAEVVSQRLAVTLGDQDADLSATFEVEVGGDVQQPVGLPLAGLAHKLVVEPAGSAAVDKAEGGLKLVAPVAGRYRVLVSGKAPLVQKDGVDSLALAPMVAPVAELEVSMPAGRKWRCAGAVVADDRTTEGRRVLRLSLPRGKAAAFETRRDVRPAETPKAIANAVVVTILNVGRDGLRRHDVALYEVVRGEVASHSIALPASVEAERVVTEEGESTPWVDGRTLRVERAKKLTGTGFLAIASSPELTPKVPLEPIGVDAQVRARYLAVGSDIAARFEPAPAESWMRVDVTDLPAAVRDAARSLGLVAAWRLRSVDAPGEIAISALPAPKQLSGLIRERRTLTLLTVEGTLVHRDLMSYEGRDEAVEVVVPPGATIWSTQVNNIPVRPLERSGRTVIPVGVASGPLAQVEVVVVQQSAVPAGRSTLSLTLPEIATPVLAHEWRLMLPERNRYRYVSGDLRRSVALSPGAMASDEAPRDRGTAISTRGVETGWRGDSVVSGRVFDRTTATVSGATLTLTNQATGQAAQTKSDTQGEFAFRSLPPGHYSLAAEMPGFKKRQYSMNVGMSAQRTVAVTLEVAAMEETIMVMAAPPSLADVEKDRRDAEREERKAQAARQYQDEVSQLKQGLVGGVKPLPVTIPQAGKVLRLTGSLPPPIVHAELAVKAPKK